jgi:phosphate transport system substrate-binding protein
MVWSQSANGVNSLISGSIDLAIAEYPTAEELAYAQSKGVELEITPIAGDTYGFIVNKNNPVKSLTTEQVAKIYSGEILNWSETGGNDELIQLFGNEVDIGFGYTLSGPNSNRLDPFFKQFFNSLPQEAQILPRFRNVAGETGGNTMQIDLMRDVIPAIGYSIYSVEGLENYKFLEITDWDMSFEYYAITRGAESELSFAKRFIRHLLTPDSQTLAEQLGYFKIKK